MYHKLSPEFNFLFTCHIHDIYKLKISAARNAHTILPKNSTA